MNGTVKTIDDAASAKQNRILSSEAAGGLYSGGTYGILAKSYYDFDAAAEIIRAGRRPASEFHALQAVGGFRLVDVSGGPGNEESWGALFRDFGRVRKIVHEINGLDGLLAMGEDVGLPAFIGLTAYGARIPMVAIVHGTFFDSPKFKAVMKVAKLFKNIRFLGMSTTVIERLIADFGVPRSRCGVGAVGVDADFFRRVPLPSGAPGVIASAGVVQRDYDCLFKAVDGLDVPVELATNSSWVAPVTFSGGVPANVKAGELPLGTGLRDLYARSRFVVVPLNPVRYSCGYTVIAEAMCMGKAVIASRNPGHSDLIVDGETGLYVPSADPAALRAAIVRLVEDPAAAERMGEAGHRRVMAMNAMAPYAETIRTRLAELSARAGRAAT